jgi:hypothetical protein
MTSSRRRPARCWLGAAALLALSCATPSARPEAELSIEVLAGLSRVPAWGPGAPSRVELLLDVRPNVSQRRVGRASGLEVARAAAADLLEALPAETPVTLTTLGAEHSASCDPVADPEATRGTPRDLGDLVARAFPRRRASLAEGLRAIAVSLPDDAGAHVVVITDLGEDCGGDLCEAARAVVERGAALDLVAVDDVAVPSCLAALVPPTDAPAPLAEVIALTAPRFQATPGPGRLDGEEPATASGVAGGPPVRVASGPVRVEVELDPPLVIPDLVLTPGVAHRLRILDFPSASPPARDWELETEPAADVSAPAGTETP